MNENSNLVFAQMMMMQMGLQADQNGRVFDPENGVIMNFKGKELTIPGSGGYDEQVSAFDPYNNPKMMNRLFSYYIDKVVGSGIDPSIFYSVEDGGGRSHVILRDGNECLKSGSYLREALRYGDIILQLNDVQASDLTALDSPIVRRNIQDKKGGNR